MDLPDRDRAVRGRVGVVSQDPRVNVVRLSISLSNCFALTVMLGTS